MLPAGTARYLFGWLVALSLAQGAIGAPPAAPPPPKEYAVQIRFRIAALGTDRLDQYFAMTRYFQSLGFVLDPNFDENPRDPEQTRLRGTIPSATARQLLQDPHVQSLLLMPAGFKVPEDADSLLKVHIDLTDGLSLLGQQQLADQVRVKLRELGFREAIGYDDRGHTRLVGLVPAGNLETLLKDLRWQPSGWLAPVTPVSNLPLPLRNVSPLLVTEVIPEPEGMPPPKGWGEMPEPVRADDPALKISPDLRTLAGQEDQPAAVRMEIILTAAPPETDRSWRLALRQAVPNLVLEGRVGTIVTGLATPRDAARLAALPQVTVVRLPRPAVPSLRTAAAGGPDPRQVLQASGVTRLFERGYRGRGVRVAVVDGDFRGYDRLKGKGLPANLRYVDLTAERNPNLLPDPFPGGPAALGSGTQLALVLLQAAPEADLTLIRIDPAAPHQLAELVRLLNGERYFSDSIYHRNRELDTDTTNLRRRAQELLQMRREALGITFQPEDLLFQPEGSPRRREMEEALRRREQYFKEQAEYDRALKDLHDRRSRYAALLDAEQDLRTIRVVCSALAWDTGYPVGGEGLTRVLEANPPRTALWFQAAGNTRGQAWTGVFRDTDGNGVMEFVPPPPRTPAAPRPDRWRAELNFLAWQPHGQGPALDLPAKARFRLSVQWQEAHDPRFFPAGENAYLRPLAELRLVVLRQRDPTGTRVAADEFDLVARSTGLPQRLNSDPASATYEQDVEFVVETAGRYALRLEGRKPVGDQPLGSPPLPAIEQNWDLWPRLFVETLDEPLRLAGRAVWGDYTTDLGTLASPADARMLTTVGAADLSDRPEPFSAAGPPYLRELLRKPNVLAYDGVRPGSGGGAVIYGSGEATALAAGVTATALSAGTAPANWLRRLCAQPGQLLRVP